MADYTTGTQTTENLGSGMMKTQNTVDCSVTNAGTTGVHAVLKIPAGAYVERVVLIITTVEDSTCTFDLGDGADPNGYDDAINGETLGSAVSVGCVTSLAGTDAYAEGKYYAAADTIDIDMDNAADTMVFKIVAFYCIVE
jgi:hypothetical protein